MRDFDLVWNDPVHVELARAEILRPDRELGESFSSLVRRRAFHHAAPKAPLIPADCPIPDLKSRLDRDEFRLVKDLCEDFECDSYASAFKTLTNGAAVNALKYELLAQVSLGATMVPESHELQGPLMRVIFDYFIHHGFVTRSVAYRDALAAAGCRPEPDQIDAIWEQMFDRTGPGALELGQLLEWRWYPTPGRARGLQRKIARTQTDDPKKAALLTRAALSIEQLLRPAASEPLRVGL